MMPKVDRVLPSGARLAQSADDVLHVDDRVVDHHPDGDHQPSEHHHVERRAGQVQDQDRGDQGQRDGDQTDEGGPPLEQQAGDDQHHQADADQHGGGQVVDRLLDERGRAEDRGVDRDVGQARLHLVDRLLDPAGHLHRVGAAVLLHHQQEALAVVDHGITDQRSGIDEHVAQIAHPHDPAVPLGDRDLRELVRILDRLNVPDVEPAVAGLDEAAGADHRAVGVLEQAGLHGVGAGVHDLLQADVVLGQLRRVDLDVALRQPLAPDRDLGDAGHPEQPGPDLPVRDGRQVGQVHLVRGEPDLQDPARRGQRRHHERRAGPARQGGGDLGQPLGDQLPGAQLVGAPAEDQHDRGQLGDRLGAHVLQAFDPVELVLDRHGDQLLHLVGGVADRDRLDLHPGRRELGEHVHLGVRDPNEAEGHHGRGGEQHDPAEGEAAGDDPAHHGLVPSAAQWFPAMSSSAP